MGNIALMGRSSKLLKSLPRYVTSTQIKLKNNRMIANSNEGDNITGSSFFDFSYAATITIFFLVFINNQYIMAWDWWASSFSQGNFIFFKRSYFISSDLIFFPAPSRSKQIQANSSNYKHMQANASKYKQIQANTSKCEQM